MTIEAPSQLRVEVAQARHGPRLWAWAIYRGSGHVPVDCSQSMFPTSAAAMRVGERIKQALPEAHPCPYAGLQ